MICAVIALALVVGRTFCGNICPVGSLQELAYAVPVQKIVIRHTEILELIRLAVFFATVIAAIYLIDLMAVTGLYDLFSLTLSAGLLWQQGSHPPLALPVPPNLPDPLSLRRPLLPIRGVQPLPAAAHGNLHRL